ncbi:MAG: hypothetical protein L3J71_15765 [Victivallaceae bacterium]|nr:hypothetical protein [Victivallaceae bacterium]
MPTRQKINFMAVLLLVFCSMTFSVQAGVSNCKEEMLPMNDWTFFQIGFWIDIPSSSANSNVYGLKTGQVISTGIGRVYGIEASWFLAGTDNISGMQVSWATCFNNQLDGLQASFGYNYSRDQLYGLQAGSVNISGGICGFQPGAVNLAQAVDGFQAGAVNMSRTVYGLQGGVAANITESIVGSQLGLVNVSKAMTGFQGGLINMTEESDGFQFGLLNFSDTSGVQLGLLNYIKDSSIPLMPFVNIKFGNKAEKDKKSK